MGVQVQPLLLRSALRGYPLQYGSITPVLRSNLQPFPLEDTWVSLGPVDVGDMASGVPMVVMDGSGNAYAIWVETVGSGGLSQVQAAILPAGTSTWGAPALLDSPNNNGSSTFIAVNASGTAVAVWAETIGLSSLIQASIYSGSGWIPFATALNFTGGTVAGHPRLSLLTQWVMQSLCGDETNMANFVEITATLTASATSWSSPRTSAGLCL